jgi:hypothetical protein
MGSRDLNAYGDPIRLGLFGRAHQLTHSKRDLLRLISLSLERKATDERDKMYVLLVEMSGYRGHEDQFTRTIYRSICATARTGHLSSVEKNSLSRTSP